jgi:hypothetical protein
MSQLFVKRLHDHGKELGTATDPDDLRERIRYAIIECGLDAVIFGKTETGKPETYAQAFERFYGEPLEPKQRKGKRA